MIFSVLSTVLVVIFAFACVGTFALGIRKEWKSLRILSTVIAIVSFALALAVSAMQR